MRGDYIVEHVTDFFIVLGHWKYGTQIWTQIQPRKSHFCTLCGRSIDPKVEECYRPVTNATNRWCRICLLCMASATPDRTGLTVTGVRGTP